MKKILINWLIVASILSLMNNNDAKSQITVTVGSITSGYYNVSNQYPAAYTRYHESTRQQILITASEMATAGAVPGVINALGFDVFDPNTCGPLPNYTIKMKQTSATSISTIDNTGLTQVYTISSYTPVNGWNTHTFSTNITWNGSSNILIDICNTVSANPPTNSNASTYATAPGFDCYVFGYNETSSQCGQTSVALFTTVRPTVQFRITPNIPSCAIISSPANDADSMPRNTTISWSSSGNTSSYDVYFGTSPNPPFINNRTTTTYNPGTLLGSTSYYWKIVAKNSYGSAIGCSTWTFNTNSGLPTCTINPSPIDNSLNTAYQPTLGWTASPGATRYRVYLGTTTNPPLIDSTTTITYTANSVLLPNTQYYWRIAPKGSYEYRNGCSINRFTTWGGCSSNYSPANDSIGLPTYLTLSWTSVPTTIKYYLYIGTSPNPPLYDSTANTSYYITDLSANTTYYWKVIPRNSSGLNAVCSEIKFRTATTNHWFIKTDGNDGSSGNCWDNAKRDLSLLMLNVSPGDTIHIAAGTYYPNRDTANNTLPADLRNYTFTLNSGIRLIGGYPASANGATLQSSLLVPYNPTLNETILNGDIGVASDSTDNCYHVVRVRQGNLGTSLLNGFTVTKGYGNGSGSLYRNCGSGIYITNANCNIHRCIIKNNYVSGTGSFGSGIYNNYGNLKINTSTIKYNKCTADGAAIKFQNGTLSMENSTVNNNTPNIYSSAVYTTYATVYINNCTFWNGTNQTDISMSGAILAAEIKNSTFNKFTNADVLYANINNCIINSYSGNIQVLCTIINDKYYGLSGGAATVVPPSNWINSLANNGGYTQTCRLDPYNGHNPAVGMGNPAYAGQPDQRGYIRSNAPCIGAYEAPYAKSSDIVLNDTVVCNGNSITLRATSNTVTNPVFNWYADSMLTLLLTTGNTYTTPVLNSSVHYYITVHNDSIYSNPIRYAKMASIYVTPVASITQQPLSINKCTGDTATFSLQAIGRGLTYKWYKGSTFLTGQTNSVLRLYNIHLSDTGYYSCLISSSCGNNIISNTARLCISSPLIISSQPQSSDICVHGNIVLRITASGNGIAYQWKKNGIIISGRTYDTLKITDAMPVHSGNYTCIVSCPCGASQTSNSAILNVHSISCSISGIASYYCTNNSPVILVGSPAGGHFNGNGITDSIFYPSIAGAGSHLITYNYTDYIGCSGTASQTILVEICTGTLPVCANLQYPANGATNVSRSTSVSWSNAGNTSSYDVYFGTSSNPPLIGNRTTTSYTPTSTLSANTMYYWKIISKNSSGSATGCSIWSFRTTTSNYPECIALPTYPSDLAINTPYQPILSWSAVPLATKYRVYLGTTPNPPLIDSTTNTSYTASTVILPNTTYYWKIVARSSSGYAGGCTGWSFTTYGGCTNAISPADGSSGIPTYTTLSWATFPTASKYYIYLGTSPNPALTDSTTSTTYNVELASNAHYYWKIVPKSLSGNGVDCYIQNFYTNSAGRSWFVKTNGSDAASGNCWDNAKHDLGLVLILATPGDTINVAAGTYYPTRDSNNNILPVNFRDMTFILHSGIKMLGGYPASASGANMHTSLLVPRNPYTNLCILDGSIGTLNDSLDNSYHVVVVRAGQYGSSTIDGFKITKGVASGINLESTKRSIGGAIYNYCGKLFVKNCIISGNASIYNSTYYCGGDGGGIYNDMGVLAVSECQFLNNYSDEATAIFNKSGTLYIRNSSFVNKIFADRVSIHNWGVNKLYVDNITSWNVVTSGSGSATDLSCGGPDSYISNSTIGRLWDNGTDRANVSNCIIGSVLNYTAIAPKYSYINTRYYDATGAYTTGFATPDTWLDSMKNYGGNTLTRRLKWISGSNPAAGIGNPLYAGTLDQRGEVRSNAPCVGAYEARYARAADIITNDTVICPSTSVTLSVRSSTITNPSFKWYSNASLTTFLYTGSSYTTPVLNTTAIYYVVVYNDSILANPVPYARRITVQVTSSLSINQQPSSVTACPGGQATFNIIATGAGLRYQWKKGSTILTGDTTNSLNLNNITYADTGSYSCTLTNTCGSQLTSNIARITIVNNAAINTQPEPATICEHGSKLFTVVASGTGLTYQWRKNGVDILNQTNDTLLINNAMMSDTGTYTCYINSLCSSPMLSQGAHLAVQPGLALISSPVSLSRCIGETAQFAASATGVNVRFQWRRNVSDIIGQINDTLLINNVAVSDTGLYSCYITAACGAPLTSQSARLIVQPDIAITQSPTSLTKCRGENATFSVSATGVNIGYYWRKNGNDLTGQNNNSLIINNISSADSGSYSCYITGECGTPQLSQTARLTVQPDVQLISSPINQSGCLGSSTLFAVFASGINVTYQWYKNGNTISGNNNDTLIINNISYADTGVYSCFITGLCGTPVLSQGARLNIIPDLSLISSPSSLNKCIGNTALFRVIVSGTNLMFQWRKNGDDLNGQDNDTLILNNIVLSDSGVYSCYISGLCGSPVLSQSATLTVNPDLLITQSPESVSKCLHDNVTLSTRALGINLIYQWRRNGNDLPGQNNYDLMLNNILRSDSGMYNCYVTGFCGASQLSESAMLTVHYTEGYITGLNQIYCLNSPADTISGYPQGGTFSGLGISGNIFHPNISGLGAHQIYYNYTDSYSCSGSATSWVTVESCTGIENNTVNNPIRIYPNPSGGVFVVDLGSSYENTSLTITDLYGKIVINEKFNNERILNILLNEPSGIYIVIICTDKVNSRFRLIKI